MSKEKKIKIEDGTQEQPQAATDDCQQENPEVAESSSDAEEEEEEVKILDPLEAAQVEIAQLKDTLLRKVAEFDNYRKRTLKEKAELVLNGGEKTITAILPVLDDFERALADKTDDPAAIKEGMELIFKKFVKTLESLGVRKIETEDKDFDVDYQDRKSVV